MGLEDHPELIQVLSEVDEKKRPSSGLPHNLRQALTSAVYRTSHHHLFRTLATEIKKDASFKRKRAATIAKLVEAKTIQDGWDGVMQNAMRDHLMKTCKATDVISISRKFVSPIALGSVKMEPRTKRARLHIDDPIQSSHIDAGDMQDNHMGFDDRFYFLISTHNASQRVSMHLQV